MRIFTNITKNTNMLATVPGLAGTLKGSTFGLSYGPASLFDAFPSLQLDRCHLTGTGSFLCAASFLCSLPFSFLYFFMSSRCHFGKRFLSSTPMGLARILCYLLVAASARGTVVLGPPSTKKQPPNRGNKWKSCAARVAVRVGAHRTLSIPWRHKTMRGERGGAAETANGRRGHFF